MLVSQYFGANRLEELRRYAASSIVLMLLLGILMSAIGLCSAELLLARFLGTPQDLLPQATLYFTIYAAGLVFQFGYNIAAAILREMCIRDRFYKSARRAQCTGPTRSYTSGA